MGKHEILPSGAFYAKIIKIFSSATSDIRINQILTFCFIQFNVSILLSLTHTHKILCILIHYFHFLLFYPLYIPTHSPSSHLMSNTQTKNNIIYLQSFDNTYLALTLFFHLILTHLSWLQPRKEGLHFILSLRF